MAAAVEAHDGRVAGPVATLADALDIIASNDVAGAIVDCELPDAPALILRLSENGVPLVAQTSVPLPPPLEALDGRLSVLMRPVNPRTVIDILATEIAKREPQIDNRMGLAPRQR